jgi:hypothetical protein
MTDAPGGYPPSDRGLGHDEAPVSGTPGNGQQTYAASTTTAPTTGATYEPYDDSPSRTDAAKEQAGQLGQTAKDSGQQVAATAKDQARGVAQEGRRQAKDLAREASTQVNQQASTQKDKAATGLRSLSDELRSMASSSEQSGPATDLAHQAAQRLGDAAEWLESRDPGHLVEEVRNLARRKPGTFLIGAAVAGVLAGRLTRGAVQAAHDDDTGSNGSSAPSYATSGTSTSATTASTDTTSVPQSGSFAGETYPAGSGTPTADEIIVVEDASPAGYGMERNR